ncbi:MAG: hypothetical protein NVS3B10_12020 [Polyangiales bacterium]
MRSRINHVFSVLPLIAALAAGCGAGPQKGTLLGPPPGQAPMPRHPQITLSVPQVADARPKEEHDGATVGTRLFIFFLVGVHIRREGNYVTDDFAASQAATTELRTLAIQWLAGEGIAKKVVADGPADFELRLTIEHLYGTHFAASKQTIVVVDGDRSTNAVVDVHSRNYAPYGNVVLRAELVDRRSGAPRVVWTEHVPGYAQRPAAGERIAEVQAALQLATADALATLSQRVGAALDRLGAGPSGAPMVLAAGSAMPGTFAIERMSRFRDFLERVYVDTATGRVLRHEIQPAPDRYASRPGDWLLARVTAEGVDLSPEGYESFARALAGKYDLRMVDDAAHYHFFGALGTSPAAAVNLP